MKRQHAPALAIGIGAVAGLRPMMAAAVIGWALRRGWIRPGRSPFARIVSGSASKRIAWCAISELIAGQNGALVGWLADPRFDRRANGAEWLRSRRLLWHPEGRFGGP